jgi:hypothetical protein
MLGRTLLILVVFHAVWARADEPAPAPPAPPPTASPAAQPAPIPAEPAPAAPPLPGAISQEETIPRPHKKWGFIFGGAAVGALVLGGALGGAALSRANEQSGNPANPPLYTRDLKQRAEEGKNLAASAYVFFGVGAALAIVDAVIWFEALRKPQVRKPSSTAQRAVPRLGVLF